MKNFDNLRYFPQALALNLHNKYLLFDEGYYFSALFGLKSEVMKGLALFLFGVLPMQIPLVKQAYALI